ncbi:MAG: cytidine deaminase [Acidobacteria bacterium]|nr:cytidine deaminase [Acidobacteriota bacterium]
MESAVDAAIRARENAFAPFSKFKVGAAVLLRNGSVVSGCNVENASYGLTICAERVAVFKAVSEGARPGDFACVVVATDAATLTPPCGACRQILWEFCGDVPVVLVNLRGERREFVMKQLLPEAFDVSNLG